jgi:hypothetical protein
MLPSPRSPAGTQHAFPALACAGLIGLWLLIDPRTADLAAAVYRSQLFARHGPTL